MSRAILFPITVTVVLALTVALLLLNHQRQTSLEDALRARASTVANGVVYAAETVSTMGELQRIVSAMSGEPGVNLIVVVGGKDRRVLASSRHDWLGDELDALPVKDVAEDIAEVLSTHLPHHHHHRDTHEFDFTAPLHLTQPELHQGAQATGAVMVHIDVTPLERESRTWFRFALTATLSLVLVICALLYLLLRRHVLEPTRAIFQAYADASRITPQAQDPAEVCTTLELHTLAEQLSRSFADRAEAELQARSSLEEMINRQQAIDQHAIVAMTNRDGELLYANPLFCSITGYPLGELLGKPLTLFTAEVEARQQWLQLLPRLQQGQSWHGEVSSLHRSGSVFWVKTSIIPFLDEKNEVSALFTISTDITEQKRSETALREARATAEAATQAKSEFLSTMSHEIRTPLNSVMGFTEALLDTPLNAEQRQYLNVMRASSETLLVLINDILDFSKIEAGHLLLEDAPVDLYQLGHDVLLMQSHRASEKGLHVSFHFSPELPRFVIGDAVRVRQILLNFVSNALKFTAKGYVRIAMLPGKPGQLRITVSDSGIGLSPDQQSRLFQRFTQADASTTRKYGGTGLGLAICKRLVELMQGQLGVISAIGQGSTFWFEIPLRPPTETPALPHSAPPFAIETSAGAIPDFVAPNAVAHPPPANVQEPATPSAPQVLIVDDTEANRVLVSALLERMGCRYAEAHNGREALALLEEKSFDLVLMDCHMPLLDGIGATEAIRANPKTAHTFVVGASAAIDDRERCLAAGMDLFIEKPLRRADLQRLIDSLAARRSA